MFPMERTAIIDGLAQGASGRDYATGTLKIHNLLDEETQEKIANSTTQRIWNGFIKFGSVSAGLMGIDITWSTIKTIINTILNGNALHKVYGWSGRLLVAAWTSLTQFCTFLEARNDPNPRECTNDVQMSFLKLQVNTRDAPNKDNHPEQSSDSEEIASSNKRFFKHVFAGKGGVTSDDRRLPSVDLSTRICTHSHK